VTVHRLPVPPAPEPQGVVVGRPVVVSRLARLLAARLDARRVQQKNDSHEPERTEQSVPG
jgi:hypothetical protein